MKPPIEHELLLADALADSQPGLRESLLETTLRQAGRRRRTQKLWQAAPALAAFAALVWWLWPSAGKRNSPITPSHVYAVVGSLPLPPAMMVHTWPFEGVRIAPTAPALVIVTTAADGEPVPRLNDGELLALLAPRPAALVGRGPHQEELVFADQMEHGEKPMD